MGRRRHGSSSGRQSVETGNKKMEKIEEALARMRAKRDAEKQEDTSQRPNQEIIGSGLKWDPERKRYFGRTEKFVPPTKRPVITKNTIPVHRLLQKRSTLGVSFLKHNLEDAVAASQLKATESESIEARVCAAAMSPEGSIVVSRYGVGCFSLEAGNGQAVRLGTCRHATCLSYIEDGLLCIGDSGESDINGGSVQLVRQDVIAQYRTHRRSVWCLDTTVDTLATGGIGGFQLSDLETGRSIRSFSMSSSDCLSLTLSESLCCAGARDGSVLFWDRRTSSPLRSGLKLPRALDHIQFLDMQTLVCADRGTTIEQRDLRLPHLALASLQGHTPGNGAVATRFFADRTFLLAGGTDSTIRLWRWLSSTKDNFPIATALCLRRQPDTHDPGALIAALPPRPYAQHAPSSSLDTFLNGFSTRIVSSPDVMPLLAQHCHSFVSRKSGTVVAISGLGGVSRR